MATSKLPDTNADAEFFAYTSPGKFDTSILTVPLVMTSDLNATEPFTTSFSMRPKSTRSQSFVPSSLSSSSFWNITRGTATETPAWGTEFVPTVKPSDDVSEPAEPKMAVTDIHTLRQLGMSTAVTTVVCSCEDSATSPSSTLHSNVAFSGCAQSKTAAKKVAWSSAGPRCVTSGVPTSVGSHQQVADDAPGA